MNGFGLSMLRGPLVKTISENTIPKHARNICIGFSAAGLCGPLFCRYACGGFKLALCVFLICRNNGDYGHFKLCANSDISAIEVNLPFGYDFFGIDFEHLSALSKKYNVRLWSYHLPFSDYFDPSALDKTEGDKALEDFKRLICVKV
ncbi:MAG: hypothetical protein L6V93_20915 [Clostridiales bacterium]|nr:MAG: hypothetical protein L6V93_20915 [Clostridiales bacterium]